MPTTTDQVPSPTPAPRTGILDLIERIGNKIPEPPILFFSLWMLVIAFSAIGSVAGWSVQPVRPTVEMVQKLDSAGAPVLDAAGKPLLVPKKTATGKPEIKLEAVGKPIEPRSLLTSNGIYWMFSSMLGNFTRQPALGLIYVAVIGIGLAERFGLFSALMRLLAIATPRKLLTPVIVLIGANSSVASDAGYIILPALAAALFLAVGRHPVAGLAAAFAGVAGGFGAGFFPTGGDGALAGFASTASHIIDPDYTVNITHNLYFKAGSALVIMLAGWFVTDRIVEPRLVRNSPIESSDTSAISSLSLNHTEKKGLLVAGLVNILILATFSVITFIPGMPLHGRGTPVTASGQAAATIPVITIEGENAAVPKGATELFREDAVINPDTNAVVTPPYTVIQGPGRPGLVERPGERWSHVIVPLIFVSFLFPGIAYGLVTGQIKKQQDLMDGLYAGVKSIVPVLTILFFLAQFVEGFKYSNLDKMLAYAGGSLLVQADLPVPFLLIAFVLLVICGDFAMSGMLSKFGVMAPIFIPMFMMVGMSPELTTAAYRIGDSVVNVITPLNSYMLIILGVLLKYRKNAGLGTLMSLMIPYSVLFFAVWTLFLLGWYMLNQDLGPESPVSFIPAS